MAGNGPPPDPNSRKSQKQQAAGGWTLISGDARVETVPDMPARPAPRRKWLEETCDTWSRWWSSPVATLWDDEDLPTLWQAIRLADAVARDPENTRLAAELRHLRAELLLTRKAQLSAHVRIVEFDAEEPEPAGQPDDGDPQGDPRLTLVAGTG